jgi:hypothetical protein
LGHQERGQDSPRWSAPLTGALSLMTGIKYGTGGPCDKGTTKELTKVSQTFVLRAYAYRIHSLRLSCYGRQVEKLLSVSSSMKCQMLTHRSSLAITPQNRLLQLRASVLFLVHRQITPMPSISFQPWVLPILSSGRDRGRGSSVRRASEEGMNLGHRGRPCPRGILPDRDRYWNGFDNGCGTWRVP